MIPYSQAFDPPAPVADVVVRVPNDSGTSKRIEALVDTGADVSVIPDQAAQGLDLAPYAEMIVEAFDGHRQRLELYAADIAVGGVRLPPLSVVAYPLNHATLGRDVLNRFFTTLNGPELTLDLRLP